MYIPRILKADFQTGISTRVFIAALFTVAKRWKQPKCPSVDEWVNNMLYIPTMEYYSALKKE